MAGVEEFYKPSHVLIPLGPKCSMQPSCAARAIQHSLPSCHTIIPLQFYSSIDICRNSMARSDHHREDSSSSSTDLGIMTLSSQLREALCQDGVSNKRVVECERETLGIWFDLQTNTRGSSLDVLKIKSEQFGK